MSTRVSVQLSKTGNWTVSSLGPEMLLSAFRSKADAVDYAREIAGPNNVLVHNSFGQIIPTVNVKTSISKLSLRNAVDAVIRAASGQKESTRPSDLGRAMSQKQSRNK